MEDSVSLCISEKSDFPVFNLFNDDDRLIIAFPHRVSISLYRMGTKVFIDCDLGTVSSSIDFCRIGELDISKSDYQSAMILNNDFIKKARSFEKSFFPEKFIRERNRLQEFKLVSPRRVFGNQHQDQVYIHLVEPAIERIANIEFSVFRSDTIDDEKLPKPAFTLCSSIQLEQEIALYWLFVEWQGNDFWSYQKNFFYNNKVFPKKI